MEIWLLNLQSIPRAAIKLVLVHLGEDTIKHLTKES